MSRALSRGAASRAAILGLLLVPPTSALAEESPAAAVWGAIKTPGSGTPQAIGGYSAGCLDGAATLPLRGDGYFVTRPERARVFGHPLLVHFIEELGSSLRKAKLPPLPIGDLAQPRGGPAPTGHASHQSGLDVDIAYIVPGKDHKAVALVDVAHAKLSSRWSGKVARVLALVVADARVDRVFVNPVIKRALCAAAGDERAWLQKIRPWWGHHDHFHVRLACPADSPLCEAQTPLAAGDGCDDLEWWFKKKSEDRDEQRKGYQARVGASPKLPAACEALAVDTPPQ